ncbi:MAG TPA: shikimate dehydrogenase [Planctomycetaceae bacterium]|nr:shikimate dehydrogenase [Planctomycetaceae bacterium]
MICISLGRTRHSSMMEEHKALAEKGAELVELRVDFMRKRPDIGRLLKDRPTPVVVTCRRKVDRGRWFGTEEQRLAILREAIIGGAEYVDLEVDVAGSIRRYGKTKRIISYHNFDETPLELFDIYQRMRKLDPDVIKIVTMANSPGDNVRVLEMVGAADVPTVGFCMGEMGTLSRVLCGRYGAPFTYASFSREREMAPGQLSWAEVRNLFRFDQINQQTVVFGVIGDPIAQSKSPLIHNAAYRKLGLNAVYLPIRIPQDRLLESLKELERLQVAGYSVTIPHKEGVLQYVDQMDEATDLMGAANTLFKHDGQWCATNTDAPAAISAIQDGLRKAGNIPELTARKVLILGAGGAARAVGHALLQHGAVVTLTNRSRDRGKSLASELGCQFTSWENRGSEICDVLVNCTSVGMHPNVDESPFEQHWLSDSALVFDTVYNPEQTLLLKQARDRGCPTVSGVEMFIRQAALQFELFTGYEAPVEYMAETLRRSNAAARTIVSPDQTGG